MFSRNFLFSRAQVVSLVFLGIVLGVIVLMPSSYPRALAFGGFSAPNPVSPEYGEVIIPIPEATMPNAVLFPPVAIPEVVWEAVDGALTYRVQFSSSIGFSTIAYESTTPNTRYTPHTMVALNQLPDGVLYWRVRVEAPQTSDYSQPMEFVKQWASPSNFPVLNSPSDGVTLDFYDFPAFTWDPVIGASSYRIEIDTDPSFSLPLTFSAFTLAPTYQPTYKLTNGTYYWRIVPRDGADKDGTPSETRLFIQNYNHIPTPLAPENNSFPTFTPTFQWTAVYGAEYYRLEYSTDPAFPGNNTTVITTRNTTYTPVITIENDVNVYWRVRTHSGLSVSEWSEVFQFLKQWYLVPTLLTPTNLYQDVRFPYFSWTPVPGATRYLIEINDENIFTGGLCFTEKTSQTSYTPQGWINPCVGPNIYWRVTPYDGSDRPGKPSEVFSFVFDPEEGNSPDLLYPLYHYTPHPLLNPAEDRAIAYPVFAWHRVTNFPEGGTVASAYRIQVSTDPLFNSVDWEFETENLSAAPTVADPFSPTEGVDYFWRVLPTSGIGGTAVGAWSQRWVTRFDASKNLTPTNGDAPELLRPMNTFEQVEYTPRLDWWPFEGATSYEVQISRDEAFTDIVDTATVPYPSYTPIYALAERNLNKTDYGTFYWRVKANNDPTWSEVWRFQVASQSGWSLTGTIGDATHKYLIGDDPDDQTDNNFELTTLYAAQMDGYWFFGFNANTAASNMTYAFYIDLDYTDDSGGTTDARGYNVTTVPEHHPEYILYVFQNSGGFSDANTLLYNWTGSAWTNAPTSLQDIGGDLYYASNYLEVQIPDTAIGYSQENGSFNLAVLSLPGTGVGSNSAPVDAVPEIAGATSSLIDRFSAVSNKPMLITPWNNMAGDPTIFPSLAPFSWEHPASTPGATLNLEDRLPDPSLPLIGIDRVADYLGIYALSEVLGGSPMPPWAGWLFRAYLDPQFTSQVYSESRPGQAYYSSTTFVHEYDFLGNNSYYWRIQSRYFMSNVERYSAWSEGFRLEREGLIPDNLQISVDFATPTFTWDQVEGIEKYRIQVDTDPNFGSPDINQETTQNSFTPTTTLANNLYYWRVQAKRYNVAYNDFSTTQTFTLSLPVPQGLVYYPPGVVGHSPTLCWNPILVNDDETNIPVLGAFRYYVQLSIDPSFPSGNNLTTSAFTEQNCYTFTGGIQDGDIYWRVAMVDGMVRLGAYSSAQTITKQYPTTTLIAPLSGSVETGAPTFIWTPVLGAEAYRLEISTSSTFPSPLYDTITTFNTRFTPVKVYGNNTYYWRVAMLDGSTPAIAGPFTDAVLILDPSGLGYKTFMPIVTR